MERSGADSFAGAYPKDHFDVTVFWRAPHGPQAHQQCRPAMNELFNKIRESEILRVRPLFAPRSHLLELGGSDGFQSATACGRRHDVVSIDIPNRARRQTQMFPVLDFDGHTIPFADDTFDAVFSSNVLEHIPHLGETFAEIRRVLRAKGIAVHVLPTPIWRTWTTLMHYPTQTPSSTIEAHRSRQGSCSGRSRSPSRTGSFSPRELGTAIPVKGARSRSPMVNTRTRLRSSTTSAEGVGSASSKRKVFGSSHTPLPERSTLDICSFLICPSRRGNTSPPYSAPRATCS